MAQSDWTYFPGGLATAIVDRGVSNGFTPPNGGGSFVHGWHSLQPDTGAAGKYYSADAPNFGPMAKGGSIRAAMRRNSVTGATPFLFLSLQSADVGGEGYLLGLAHDESPARLVLIKGAPSQGLAIASAVAQSTAAYQVDNWLHVRLDIIRQPADDVLIKVYENDLSNPVSSPTWVEVPGLEATVDDVLGINTGSQPYLGGYGGVGYYTAGVGRQGFHDHVELFRQL